MPKKKVTTRKKTTNTAPVDQQQAMIVALQDLTQNEGWQIVVNNFKSNIDYLAECILDKVDSEGMEIEEMEVDRLRDKRDFMRDLIKTPETFIAQLQQSPENTAADLDPYHDNITESQSADLQTQAQSESEFLEVTKDP